MERRWLRTAIGLALLAAATGIAVGQTAGKATPAAERLVATVDNQPILLSELEGRAVIALNQMQIGPGDTAAVREVRRQVLEDLIDQRVLEREADAKAIRVGDEEVTAAVDEAIQRNREMLGSEEAFRRQLTEEGITEEELRQRYREEARREMLGSRLVQAEFHGEATITPAEVRTYFDEHRSELPEREASIHLQRLAIRVQPDSVVMERARALALDVRQRVLSQEMTFGDAARRWSADASGPQGGELGRVQRGALAGRLGSAFEDSVFALPAGAISQPLGSPAGYQLVWMQEKDPAGQWVQISLILLDAPVMRADQVRAKDRADGLLARLRAGEGFDALARRYSEAPEGAQGGELGEVPLAALQDSVRVIVEKLGVGDVSPVIQVEGAFVIFRVLGREAGRPYTYAEVESELTEWLRQRRIEEQYRTWMDGIKARHYIERRLEE
jgi:parvulin-like peptidyl-prolyl isomerase